MIENLTDYFEYLIREADSVDIAIAEFKKNIANDTDLRRRYREWCNEQGTTEKHGFSDFCEEYLENQNDVWNSLTDYDE